jgi:hypothetical protein
VGRERRPLYQETIHAERLALHDDIPPFHGVIENRFSRRLSAALDARDARVLNSSK